MNYAVGHSFLIKDLFLNFPVRKLKLSQDECVKLYPDGSKRDFAASIFMDSVEMVVNDIIDDNVHFKFPGVGRTLAYLYMKRTSGNKFKKAFKNGKWRDVDFIMSDFSGYLLSLKIENNTRLPKEKTVYLSPKYKLRITDNVNSGKLY